MPSTPSSRVFIAMGLMMLIMEGCSSDKRTVNVKMGDDDYPLEQGRPLQTLEIVATVPSTLRPKFLALYKPNPALIDKQAQRPCGFINQEGTQVPFFVLLPLEPSNESIGENGSKVLIKTQPDHFAPGRCGWTLVAVVTRVDGYWPDDLTLFAYADANDKKSDDVGSLDIYCARVPNEFKDKKALRSGPAARVCVGPRPQVFMPTGNVMVAVNESWPDFVRNLKDSPIAARFVDVDALHTVNSIVY